MAGVDVSYPSRGATSRGSGAFSEFFPASINDFLLSSVHFMGSIQVVSGTFLTSFSPTVGHVYSIDVSVARYVTDPTSLRVLPLFLPLTDSFSEDTVYSTVVLLTSTLNFDVSPLALYGTWDDF